MFHRNFNAGTRQETSCSDIQFFKELLCFSEILKEENILQAKVEKIFERAFGHELLVNKVETSLEGNESIVQSLRDFKVNL